MIAWYDQEAYFWNYEYSNSSSVSVHFEQIVWVATTAVGCGRNINLYVCHFSPGLDNVGLAASDNVQPLKAAVNLTEGTIAIIAPATEVTGPEELGPPMSYVQILIVVFCISFVVAVIGGMVLWSRYYRRGPCTWIDRAQ